MTVTFWEFVIRKSNSSVYKKIEEKPRKGHNAVTSKSSRHQYLPHLTLDDEVRVIETLYDGHLML